MQIKQSTRQKLKYQVKSSSRKNRTLLSGTILAVLILISPYVFTLYQGFPDKAIWETFFGTYESTYYESVNVVAWTLWGKLIPLYLLLIWFFTCRHWWYHVILVPIAMYIIQIFDIFNDDLQFSDQNDIFILAPIIFIFAIFSYTVRTRVFDKIHGIDLSELSRVNWKGEVQDSEDEDSNEADDDEEDDTPIFMG